MSPPKPITVLLADDHAIVRQGLGALLKADGSFKIIGEAKNGREAVELARTSKPDVILMDIAMPLLNGLEATRQILTANPAARIIILSAHSDDAYVDRMCAAGVAGFVEKQTSADILAEAIHEVAKGKTFYSPSITKRMMDGRNRSISRDGLARVGPAKLTQRETEVLQLVAEGKANKQMAAMLNISIKTIEKHRQHLMGKLNIHETASLTRYAIAQGMVESSVQLTII